MNKSRHYITCTIIQNGDGKKFIEGLKDAIIEIQNQGLYVEVQYNNTSINTYSTIVMSYKMD